MKERLLKILREHEGYISGEEIGNRLGVSRSAVWKVIKSMRLEGYEIDAVTNKGYVLKNSEGAYSGEEIKSRLSTNEMGCEVRYFETVDSTNNKAKALGMEGAPHGTAVIAEVQTAGKGRRGRAWTSPVGGGVWMSVILRPEILPQYVSSITLAAGISVCDAVNKMANVNAKIKWPNDIVINGRKICGILTEMSGEISRVDFVVVGMGVNVNTESFEGELGNVATSLMIETGHKFSRSDMAVKMLEELEKNYAIFVENGFLGLKNEYEKRCATLNKKVDVSGSKNFTGIAVGVTDEGALLVENDEGRVLEVMAGDVSIREAQP
ncbi:MAG: biotin--[acetyl-CoA-carboxylase] ligase [Firmicutes bacterium]|nr:biotin--[acetyl-CoA-carboxylase] ligase [Bacillota bacterium]